MNTIKIGNTSGQSRHIDSYVASTGEKFEIYETFDLMNEMFIEAFPYTNEGLRSSSLAKSKCLEQVKEDVEEFLKLEVERKAERLANAEPEREAFSRGAKDAKSTLAMDLAWLANASSDEQEAYRYAFNKHSNS